MKNVVTELKQAAEFFSNKGYLLPGASSGNISMRNKGNMIITLSGESLDALKEGNESFCEVSLMENHQIPNTIDWEQWDLRKHGLERKSKEMLISGQHYTMSQLPETKQGLPSFETYLHLEIYKNIQYANAVVHLHSSNSTNFACLDPCVILKLRNQCQSSFPNYDIANVVPYINVARIAKCGPILWCPQFPAASNELHEYIWKTLKTNKSVAILMQNHGVLCIGLTIMDAAKVAAEIEQELGIILDILRVSGGKNEYLSYVEAEDVEWYWEHISKGNPWKKLYAE